MIALGVGAGAAIALGLAVVRLFIGPTLYDRMLVVSIANVMASVICAALAVAAGKAAFVDAALALMLATLVLNVAALKFFRTRSYQPPLARGREAV